MNYVIRLRWDKGEERWLGYKYNYPIWIIILIPQLWIDKTKQTLQPPQWNSTYYSTTIKIKYGENFVTLYQLHKLLYILDCSQKLSIQYYFWQVYFFIILACFFLLIIIQSFCISPTLLILYYLNSYYKVLYLVDIVSSVIIRIELIILNQNRQDYYNGLTYGWNR